VRADGVALLISRAAATGRLKDQKLSRLQTLLTSEQFREEVARKAQQNPRTPEQVCSDQISNEVTMGKLSMSRTEQCGEETRPTPAFDEIISIVAPAMRGTFDGPVKAPEPLLVPVRLERSGFQDRPDYTMKIDATVRGTMTPTSGGSMQRDLSVEQRDTLRLLLCSHQRETGGALHVDRSLPTAGRHATRDLWSRLRIPGAAIGVPRTDRATGRRIQRLTRCHSASGRSMGRPPSATLTLTRGSVERSRITAGNGPGAANA
jgi:hypothetical protein